MVATITLPLIEKADEDDTVLVAGVVPLFDGHDPEENLACGGCKAVLCEHVATRTLHRMFSAPKRLMIRCTCGALNLIPSKKHAGRGR